MWRRCGGVLAAYLLVLQAIVAGLAIGAQPVAADPFAVICHTSDAAGSTEPEKRHIGFPKCCVAGCPMLGGGMAPPAAFTPTPPTAAGRLVSRMAAHGPAAPSSQRTPRSTRAPPTV